MKLNFNTLPDYTYKVICESHINGRYNKGYVSERSSVRYHRFLFLILQSLSVRCNKLGIIHECHPPVVTHAVYRHSIL